MGGQGGRIRGSEGDHLYSFFVCYSKGWLALWSMYHNSVKILCGSISVDAWEHANICIHKRKYSLIYADSPLTT